MPKWLVIPLFGCVVACAGSDNEVLPTQPSNSTTLSVVVADVSIASHLPLRFVADGEEMPIVVTTAGSPSTNYCASSDTAGLGVGFVSPSFGNHIVQAFSLSDNSYWSVQITLEQGKCSITRLTCQNGICGDPSAQNFGFLTTRSDRTLNVCVRDYECEDGDRVSVDFGNAQQRTIVFSNQELFNAPACRAVAVPSSGIYSFSLYANNGTGFKGRCDFSDSNTGEVTISGATTATARWQLRGGAGTFSNGYVKVP